MKKNLRQDFADAEFLNSRLIVASTCFELDGVPAVRFICCNEDVFSMMIAEQLRNVLEKNGISAKIIASEGFRVLVSPCPGIKEWIAFDNRFHDCMAKPRECIFVANRVIAQNKQRGDFSEAHFAIIEEFKNTSFAVYDFIRTRKGSYGTSTLKNADFVVCYDDDVVSAYHAVRLWWQLYCLYGKEGPSGKKRKFVCVGGKGLMSSRLYKHLMKGESRKTEGRLLAKTAFGLYMRPQDVIVCDKGSNTGENLSEIAEIVGDNTAIAAVTQRLSLILYMSQKQQQPGLKLDYLVIWQSVSETVNYLNGMRYASAKPILHYWAHVLRRWKIYSAEENKFMLPVFGIDQETERCAARLQSKYVVKQRDFPIKAMWQMLPFIVDLTLHGRWTQYEYNIVLRLWQRELKREFKEYLYTALP